MDFTLTRDNLSMKFQEHKLNLSQSKCIKLKPVGHFSTSFVRHKYQDFPHGL